MLLKYPDLSKAIDCIPYDFITAKLHPYSFYMPSLKLTNLYLANRQQRVKINISCSLRKLITYGTPQVSILGPVLFNIFIMFFIIDVDVARYVDNNTP